MMLIDRLGIALRLVLAIIVAVLTISVQAKDLSSLKMDDYKYLYELGQVTTEGREYNFSLMSVIAKNWKEIVGGCEEILRKTPGLHVDFYVVIRPDGSVSNIVADEIGREKNGNKKKDDSIACVAESLFFVSYPGHTFSFFFWKFSYVPDFQSHFDQTSKSSFFHAREIWRSGDSNYIASLSDDGRIYLCIGASNKSLKTLKVIGRFDNDQSVNWGATYMIFQGELVNLNEELPDKTIKYKVINHQHGFKLEDGKESIVFENRLNSMPKICDRPN